MNARNGWWTELLVQSSFINSRSTPINFRGVGQKFLYVWQQMTIDRVAYLWWDREQAGSTRASVSLGHYLGRIGRAIKCCDSYRRARGGVDAVLDFRLGFARSNGKFVSTTGAGKPELLYRTWRDVTHARSQGEL